MSVTCPKCGGTAFVYEDSTWNSNNGKYDNLYRCWGLVNDIPCREMVLIEGPRSRLRIETIELEEGEKVVL